MEPHHFTALKNWIPPAHWSTIRTIDMHTGGEPLRVIIDGLPGIPGDSILSKRRYFRDHYDHLRTSLMFEPRGHADMYGAVITEPVTGDGDFGVFFMHNEGYSTMCGHAIIALTKLAVETGMVNLEEGAPFIQIDAPPGRIIASAKMEGDKVRQVSFLNVPSFIFASDQETEVPGIGPVRYDIAYGGAFYAICESTPLGISLEAGDHDRIIEYGKKIKKAVMKHTRIEHPYEEDLAFLYGTIFTGPPDDPEHHSRNVCVFADGEVDRSPTGTGVSARAALHWSKGEMEAGKKYTIESILGTTMDVRIARTTRFGPYDAVIPEVSGTAYFTGMHEFLLDPEDPVKKGFIFR